MIATSITSSYMIHANHFSAGVCRCFHSGKALDLSIVGEKTENDLYVLLKQRVHYSTIVFEWGNSEASMEEREI